MEHLDLMVYKEITDGTGVQVPYFPEGCVCPATAWMNEVVRKNAVYVTREFLGIMTPVMLSLGMYSKTWIRVLI